MKTGKSAILVTLAIAGLLAACQTVTPRHSVRPHPDFIRAGIEPGDRVEILTVDGRELEFEVTSIESGALAGEAERVEFSEIRELYKVSWKAPEHPCGGGKPVGCSIPKALAAVDYYEEYGERFDESCVQHDFCYRHGYATYGTERGECDEQFYADMKKECGSIGWLDLDLVDNFQSKAECLLAAEQLYRAVRRYGDQRFETTGSTYCEYDGAPDFAAP